MQSPSVRFTGDGDGCRRHRVLPPFVPNRVLGEHQKPCSGATGYNRLATFVPIPRLPVPLPLVSIYR
jgi:hypothetical protein